MRANFKSLFIGFSALALFCQDAMAQTATPFSDPFSSAPFGSGHFEASDRLGMRGGLQLTIPLGAQHQARSTKTQKHKARLGLTLALDHQSQNRWSGVTSGRSANMLELGFFEGFDPNLSLMGQNFYQPDSGPLYANGANGRSTKILLIVAGAAVVVGGTVILANELAEEIAEDLADCIIRLGENSSECT